MIITSVSQNLIMSLVNPEVYFTFTRDINFNNFINDGNTNNHNLTFDFPKA